MALFARFLAGLAHKAMAVEHGMNRRPCGNTDISRQLAHQEFPDLAGAPVRLVSLQGHDHPLDLIGQLVGVAHRSP
jgi:hypothetical protein